MFQLYSHANGWYSIVNQYQLVSYYHNNPMGKMNSNKQDKPMDDIPIHTNKYNRLLSKITMVS
jgi:hypothetical protein